MTSAPFYFKRSSKIFDEKSTKETQAIEHEPEAMTLLRFRVHIDTFNLATDQTLLKH